MVLTNDMISPDSAAIGASRTAIAFDITTYLGDRKTLVEAALDQALPLLYPETLYDSMRYSLLAGGKRLRPILCLASCELAGGTVDMAMPTACALEMLHTMSLIHDDLPAMDNDDYRRGKLTNHKVYGEDIAILAGDGLLTYAFEYMARHSQLVPAERVLQVIVQVATAVGAAGLVGGQVVDLQSEGKSDVCSSTLDYIHSHKTGALLEACVVSGAILAGASFDLLGRLADYAKNIGLAFQIVDDILDITASSDQLGKTAGKDVQAKKVTYPSLWGVERSRQVCNELIMEARELLEGYGDGALPLLAIADFIVARSY